MVLSDFIACIALAVSIGALFFQWYLDTRINKINLEADYFQKLYLDHLLYHLPQARTYIRFSGIKLVDFDKLLDELNIIRYNSLYYKFADKDFYTNLKIELQNLEDFLIQTGNEDIQIDKQNEVFSYINLKLEGIYQLFNAKYTGK